MTINISQIKAQCKLTVNAGLDKTVNAGNSEELYAQASGGSTYTFLWSDGATTQSNIVIPTTTTTYTVTVTSGSCSATDAVVLTYNFCLSVNAGSDQTISSGKSTTLTAQATGGSNQTYSWSNGKTSLGTTASITASPTTRTTYYVTAKYSTCLATDNLVVFVDPTTPTNPTSGTATIKFTTSSLGGNYDPEHVLAVWITDSKGNFVKTLELNAATRKQYLTGWAASSAYNTVDAVTGPTLLDHTSHVVTWNGLDFDGNPVADGNYIVNIEFTDDIATGISQTIPFTKGTQSQHLTPADQSNFTSMDLQWTPSSGCNLTVSAGQDKTISKGSTVTLTATASGGSNYSYSWNPGNFTTSSISVTPSTPNTYIVTVTSGSCTATAKVGVCVLMVDAGSSQTINSGQTATLSPYISCSGSGYTFTWNNGMAGQSITVSPTTTTTYILTVSGNGATATGSVVITVNGQACNLSVNAGSNQTICIGKSATLTSTVTGAGSVTTYTWSNNSNQQNTVVTPTGTTTYFITVNSGTCSASNSVVITTHILPTPNAGPDVTITSGQSTTLNCTSGVSFVWSNNQSGSSIVVSPTVTTSYTVTATDVAGCTATDGVKVTVNQPACNLTVNAGGDWTVCLGTNIQITANPTGGTYYSYLWSTLDTTKSIKVAPTANTTYKVTVISGNCTASTTVKVTVNSVPNANAGANQTIISGNSATLTATGGGTYTWSNAANTASITVSPTTTTTYYVTVTLNTCQKVSSVIVFVNQPSCNLAVNAGTNQTICSGKTANLTATASGGTNYTYKWSNNLTTASISVTPATTTTYTLTTTSGNCTATASVSVTVNQTPIANAGADQTICNGSCTTLTATGGGIYLWSNGTSTATISVCPTTNTIFIVTVTSNNCTATDNISVTVNQNPIASAGADQTVCAGACTSLSATGGGTYLWSNGTNTASNTVCPSLSTTYIVTVTNNNNCTATDQTLITVISLPTANAGANQTIITGNSATLTATGGVAYKWSNNANTASTVVSPTTTTSYFVTATSAYGCTATSSTIVYVNPVPCNLTASAGQNQTICNGKTANLSVTASGGTNYSYKWTNNATTATISVSPTNSTTYTVTVTSANCTATASAFIIVNQNPSVNAGADQSVISGNSITLTASGGTNYIWSNNANTSYITVAPTATTTYTVTGTTNNCSATDNVIVTVLPPCALKADAGQNKTICSGSSADLTATGTGGSNYTYIWSNNSTTATISVSPNISTNYIVTLTSSYCTATATVSIIVNQSPSANAGPDQSIPLGTSATLTVSGGKIYLWSEGSKTSTIVVSPTVTTTYTVTVTTDNCSNTDAIIVKVTPPICNLSVSAGSNQTICSGKNINLTANASGGNNFTYTWNNQSTTPIITISPTASTTYSVTVVSGYCLATSNVTVYVNQTPVANAGSDQTIISGTVVNLLASGGTSYSWSNGQTSASISVNPRFTTTYIVTVASNNCSATDAMTIFVNQPVCNVQASAGSGKTINQGGSVVLTASGGVSYSWTGNKTTQSITVSPTVTTTYSVTVTDNLGCTGIANAVVTINKIPVVSAGQNLTICLLDTVRLNGTGGVYYHWNTGSRLQSILVNPTTTTTYTVTATSASGATSSSSAVITVLNVSADAGPDRTICKGSSITITASGIGNIFQWSTGANTSSIVVTPTVLKIYLLTVKNGNCKATDNVVVRVVSASASAGGNKTICNGNSATLTATGGAFYNWSNGANISTIIVNPGLNSTYTVTATSSNGCTASSNSVVTVTNCKDNKSITYIGSSNVNINSISVYPNPGNGLYIIEGKVHKHSNVKVKVMNLIGLTIFESSYYNSSELFRKEIDLEKFADGIYILSLESDGQKVVKSLIKR